MNSEATPATATLTKTPNTSLYSSSRQVYARLECKQGKAGLTSDPQPSRAKLASIRAATDIANPTASTPAFQCPSPKITARTCQNGGTKGGYATPMAFERVR